MRTMPTPPYTLGAGALAGLVVIDVVTAERVAIAGYFGLAVLVAAAACTPVATLWLGLVAVGTAFVSGLWDDRFLSSQHWAAVVLVLCQSAVAVYVAGVRRTREAELSEVRAVAEVAQRALLPSVPKAIDGIGFATRYLSAAHAASVGGDLYEVVHTPHTIRLIIGDVKGKGLPAVRLATVVLGAFREAATTWLDPEQVAAACARAVSREADAEDFVTALLVDIHADGRLSLCSAGHHPPYLLSGGVQITDGDTGGRVTGSGGTSRGDSDASDSGGGKSGGGKSGGGTVSQLRMATPSPPLGIAERFTATSARWDVDDRLLLFTDGLIEARDGAGEFFPIETHLAAVGSYPLEAALDRLTRELSNHVGGALHDDLALVLAQRGPRPDEPLLGQAQRRLADLR